jgi:fused signal recognition particle receptor
MAWWWIALAAGLLVVLAAVALALAHRARRRPPGGRSPRTLAPSPRTDPVRRGLLATRRRLAAQLEAAVRRPTTTFELKLTDLTDALVAADVGVRTAAELVERVRARVSPRADEGELRQALRDELRAVIPAAPPPEPTTRPWVILVTGVNGVGKTTTVGKLAARQVALGRRVMLVAADTFRAAGIDQLQVWAERTGSELVRQAPGADPSAVAFDGIRAAMARGVDIVLVDTAGRLHTRSNLMEELRKVRRVITRELPGAPHETLLVLDATTGQNAVAQARTFLEAVSVTGLVLTKLDGTARGGSVIAIGRELGLPIRYIGVGESVDDLRPFEPAEFVSALIDPEDPLTSNDEGRTLTPDAGRN